MGQIRFLLLELLTLLNSTLFRGEDAEKVHRALQVVSDIQGRIELIEAQTKQAIKEAAPSANG